MNATNYESLVLEVTSKLGDKMGTIAPHAWEVLVRQSYVWGLTCLASFLMAAVIAAILVKITWFKLKPSAHDDEKEAAIWVVRTLVGIGVLVLIIASFTTLPDIITAFVNPEYRAMMSLVGK